MKPLRWINLIIILSLLSACSFSSDGSGFPSIFSTPIPLPTAQATIKSPPDAEEPVRAYLDAFKADDYATMYGMLTQVSHTSWRNHLL